MAAYYKMMWMCHHADTEVGGFGVLSKDLHKDGTLYVEDFRLVKQRCTGGSMEFDDDGLAAYLDWASQQPDYSPERFMRLWIHTHPGDSANPSSVDENTFKTKFGTYPWSIMMIVSRKMPHPHIYVRLKYTNGPGVEIENIPVYYKHNDAETVDKAAWLEEFNALVEKKQYNTYKGWTDWRERVEKPIEGSVLIGLANDEKGGTTTTTTPATTSESKWKSKIVVPDFTNGKGHVPVSARPVIWWDEREKGNPDFRNDMVNDNTHWRDYSTDIPETEDIFFYRGVNTGTMYAFPCGDAGTLKEFPEGSSLYDWVYKKWSDIKSGRPVHVSQSKYTDELIWIRAAIHSGRFKYGRTFRPVSGDSSPGIIKAASGDDSGLRGDRGTSSETTSHDGGGYD